MRTLGSGDIIYIIMAVRWTLLLSLVAFLGGAIGGALVALARTSEFKGLRFLSARLNPYLAELGLYAAGDATQTKN